jgi:hypothetical protein
MSSSSRFLKVFTTAGLTIFLAFLASRELIVTAPFDSGQRGAGHGALSAAVSLDILWVLVAIPVVLRRRREIRGTFWLVFVPNTLLALLAVVDVVKHALAEY